MSDKKYYILLASVWLVILFVGQSPLVQIMASLMVIYAGVKAVFVSDRIVFTGHMIQTKQADEELNNKQSDGIVK